MKITYVKHSCFAVELAKEYNDAMPMGDEDKNVVLLFDYYQGEIPHFPKESFLYVFVSHKHADHYNQAIFQLADQYENIVFFLSKEIRMNEKYMERCNIPMKARGKIAYAHAEKEYELVCGNVANTLMDGKEQGNDHVIGEIHSLADIVGIQVKTYKSTDSGVAYLVQYAGKTIYHAGDLNWWKAEISKGIRVPEPELEKMKDADIRMERNFKKEVALLAEDSRECGIDAAFLPLDGRLGRFAGLGFTYYMQECGIKKAYPMHLWEDYGLIRKYKESRETTGFTEKIVEVRGQGEVFQV